MRGEECMNKINKMFKGLIVAVLILCSAIGVQAATVTRYSVTKTFTYGTIVKCNYNARAQFTNKIYDSGTAGRQITSVSLGNPSITLTSIDNKYTYVNLGGNISWPSNYNNPVYATVYCE